MLDDDLHIGELVAPYVLGALEPDEVEQVELHLLSCPVCRALVEEQREAVNLLPYLADPVPVPSRVRRSILDWVRDEPDDLFVTPMYDRRAKVTSILTRLGWLAAVSVAVLAVVLAWNSFQMQDQVNKKNTELNVLKENQQTVAQVLSGSNGSVTTLQTTGIASGAKGGVVMNPTKNAALLVVEGLPKPTSGHVYVVWMTRGNDHVNAGVLPVDNQGRGTLYITMQQALASFDGILVTEETSTTVSSPSGTHMLAARVNN